uniref:Uncharacterized protein n=1 Tax=Serinus canaria TaxID=9135 RepID=A0A8C9N4Y7_SERCA
MLSRLQELRREEETLLRVKAALHDQLRRLRVEELALQSMIRAGEENVPVPLPALAEDTQQVRGSLGSEGAPTAGWQHELGWVLQLSCHLIDALITANSAVKCPVCSWFVSRVSPFPIPKSSTVFPGGLGNTWVL